MLDFLGITKSPRERLAYIELRVQFMGHIRRMDLVQRFGIKHAAASRDLSLYTDIAPQNLRYLPSTKSYLPTAEFRPLFRVSQDRVVSWLLHGYGDGVDQSPNHEFAVEDIALPITFDTTVLSTVTTALNGRRQLSLMFTGDDGVPTRLVAAPTALFRAGPVLYVRLFDQTAGRFVNLPLPAITHAITIDGPQVSRPGSPVDRQWHEELLLDLRAHPASPDPALVEACHGMLHGMLHVKARAATAGYLLRAHGVDCSPHQSLPAASHPLYLANRRVLALAESASLAPGFEMYT